MLSPKVYEEVYEILSHMDKATVMKIPLSILEEINNNRDINYISKIDPNDLFNEYNVERETIVFIAWLDYNYIANDEEKEWLHDMFIKNQYEYEENLKKRFNASNKPLFFDGDISGEEAVIAKDNSLVEQNTNFLIRLKNFIKNIFFKLKKK